MIDRNTPIQYSDLQALATLANTKLSPATPFNFNAQAGVDRIGLPADITVIPTYNGPGAAFGDGVKVTVWLYGYKTIGTVKYYSAQPLVKAFNATPGNGPFTINWKWTSVIDSTAPDGYILVYINDFSEIFGAPAAVFFWQDIHNVQTFSETGAFNPPWLNDISLISSFIPGGVNTGQDLPCGHGFDLKMLNNIRHRLLRTSDIDAIDAGNGINLGQFFPGETGNIKQLGKNAIVSGPVCVSAGSNVLNGSRVKSTLYDQQNGNPTVCYCQQYLGIAFRFRTKDAPNGINITVQNQYLGMIIGAGNGGSFTFGMTLTSCSNGHIKITQSGTSTVLYEQDVTAAGAPYTIQFNAAPTPQPATTTIDVVFTVPATTTSTVLQCIADSETRIATVNDSYFQLQFINPRLPNNLNVFSSTTCGQLVVTENNSTVGVWTAMTVPSPGVMTFLDQDLPQYFSHTPNPSESSRAYPLNPGDTTAPPIPSVGNRGALWPIFRDTDFIPDNVGGKAMFGSTAWQNSISTKYVETVQYMDLVPAQNLNNLVYQQIFAGQLLQIRLMSSPGTVCYIKASTQPTTTSYDATFNGGAQVNITDLIPGFVSNEADTYWVGIYNPTSNDIQNTLSFVEFLGFGALGLNAPNGTFFSTSNDAAGNTYPNAEPKSYSLRDPFGEPQYVIPTMGQCIYSITVERASVDSGNGVFIVPTTGTQDLDVSIGLMNGYGFDAQGTFQALIELTIPAGQGSVTLETLIPVLAGAPLAYQSSEQVLARPAPNFQPMMYSQYVVQSVPTAGGNNTNIGNFYGVAWYSIDKACLFLEQTNVSSLGFILPLTIEIPNDLTSILDQL